MPAIGSVFIAVWVFSRRVWRDDALTLSLGQPVSQPPRVIGAVGKEANGAPGACYPGASEFGAYSGLTCFLADELSREGIFKAIRQRRHYGTIGCRMHLNVTADLGDGGGVYAVDPRIEETDPVPSNVAPMGDIVRVGRDQIDLSVSVEAPSPIERVDILNGAQMIETLRPHAPNPEGRIRVIWQGAENRGRGRTTLWQSKIKLDEASIRRMKRINIWNLDRTFEIENPQTIVFDTVTTGNFGGCDI